MGDGDGVLEEGDRKSSSKRDGVGVGAGREREEEIQTDREGQTEGQKRVRHTDITTELSSTVTLALSRFWGYLCVCVCYLPVV